MTRESFATQVTESIVRGVLTELLRSSGVDPKGNVGEVHVRGIASIFQPMVVQQLTIYEAEMEG